MDNSATTPLDGEVLKAMMPYFCHNFGNASSIHSFGQEARAAVDASRKVIADFLDCQPEEIIFTSGGSESDNLAIRGLIEATSPTKLRIISRKYENTNNSNETSTERAQKNLNKLIPHVITSAFEHHAVLDTIKELEKEGAIEASYIKPNNDGIINPKDIEKAIKENTVLVSIMYVNNEVGTVQPIREIGKMIQMINVRRQTTDVRRIFFHTDAVQAAECFDVSTKYLHIDMLTMTAHKIYGPKGVGLLFVRKGTPLKHQIVGGGQEYKKRAGTENVAGIVGLAAALRQVKSKKLKVKSIIKLRDQLIDGILKNISDTKLNGSRELRSPANVNVSFKNAEGESILINLDLEGIAASSGSACTSGSLEPSHVLTSMGIPAEESHGSIRFTLGRHTSKGDIDKVLQVLPPIINKLRKMSPYK